MSARIRAGVSSHVYERELKFKPFSNDIPNCLMLSTKKEGG